MNNIIETFDLTKIFPLKGKNGGVTALNNVNISVKEGEIFGLLGPNGAGKTTLIQILTTVQNPTSGYALIDGYNTLKSPKKAKSKIALMLEKSMLYYRITGYDNLKFFCKIYKVPNYKEKILPMAKSMGLERWLNQYVSNYSNGMKMKLALCRTFLINRPINFLDEPTLGLDVKLKAEIVEKLRETNSTIFLTSHDMGVVEKLCDRIAFINKGKIIKIGTKEDIRQYVQSEIKIQIRTSTNKKQLKFELDQQEFIKETIEYDKGLLLILKDRERYTDLFKLLTKYRVQMIKELEMSVEDLFLSLI